MNLDTYLSLLVPDPSGCLLWKGYETCHGYGRAWFQLPGTKKATHHYAHRIMETLVNGPIPDEMTISHLCEVKLCCNEEHWELMTWEEHGLLTYDQEEGRVIWVPGLTLHELRPAEEIEF